MIRHSAYAFLFYPITSCTTFARSLALFCSFPVSISLLELPEHYKTSDKIKVANDAFLQVLRFLPHIVVLFWFLKIFQFVKTLRRIFLKHHWKFCGALPGRTLHEHNALRLMFLLLFPISFTLIALFSVPFCFYRNV